MLDNRVTMVSSPPSNRRKRRTDDKERRYNDDEDDRGKSKKSRRRSRSRSKERERDRYSDDRRRDDRGRDRERHRDKERDNKSYDNDDRNDSPVPKKKPMTDEEARIALLAKLQAQKLAEETMQKRAAEQRRQGVHPPEPAAASKINKTLNPMEAAAYIDLQVNKVQELKNKIAQNKAVSLLSTVKPATDEAKPKEDIELSKLGSEVDDPEIKVEEEEYGIVDPRLSMKGPGRGRRSTFKFVKEGEYQKQAHIQRNTARLHLLQSEIETVAKQTGISTAVKLALVTPDVDQGTSTYLPSIEWWDEHVLKKKTYDAIPSIGLPPEQRYTSSITRLIEHPIQLKAPDEPVVPTMLKVYLTKKERKKLRRQNRREILKEEAEKVRLGLKPPPEPKVKIGNLMKVLGTDAIQDPTKMEAHVREQMAARMKKHLKANADRKLTKEERSDKKKRKIAEDTTLNVNVSIYRIKSLAHPSKKFKAETNAKQLAMTGVMVIYKDINLIVVEGGPKQQKFYKNLMLNRIKWSEEIIGQEKKKKVVDDDDEDDDDENAAKNFNECQLVWEGIVRNRAFNDFRVHLLQSPKQVREFLEKHGVSHYWDHAYSTSVLLSEEPE
uniref:U4/U6 small nuclear ribonucleoprotein Prp3 n=1 Tax=Panagrolaimus sp. ES5 TaxID=591445 RepID=A0AC34F7S9_9BILA